MHTDPISLFIFPKPRNSAAWLMTQQAHKKLKYSIIPISKDLNVVHCLHTTFPETISNVAYAYNLPEKQFSIRRSNKRSEGRGSYVPVIPRRLFDEVMINSTGPIHMYLVYHPYSRNREYVLSGFRLADGGSHVLVPVPKQATLRLGSGWTLHNSALRL